MKRNEELKSGTNENGCSWFLAAIENYRQQIAMESLFYGRSECEEQASGEGQPVLEEFLPLKPSSSSEEDKSKETHDKAGKKSEWLMSVPLWNQDPPHETEVIGTLIT